MNSTAYRWQEIEKELEDQLALEESAKMFMMYGGILYFNTVVGLLYIRNTKNGIVVSFFDIQGYCEEAGIEVNLFLVKGASSFSEAKDLALQALKVMISKFVDRDIESKGEVVELSIEQLAEIQNGESMFEQLGMMYMSVGIEKTLHAMADSMTRLIRVSPEMTKEEKANIRKLQLRILHAVEGAKKWGL